MSGIVVSTAGFILIRPSATFSPWEKALQSKPVKLAMSVVEEPGEGYLPVDLITCWLL
jgi:hypothetical protein